MPQSQRSRVRAGLRLEILEGRLPPGDIMLGIGMTLASFGSDRAAGTETLAGSRQFGGLSWDDGDDTANLSILAGDVGPVGGGTSTMVRLGHSHAAVEHTADVAAPMAWRPAAGRMVWRPAGSNANDALLLRGPLPDGPGTWGNALIALDMPASSERRTVLSVTRTGMSVPQEFLQVPPSSSRALSVSDQAPLAFDPASGRLAIWGPGGGERIGETITPGGFLEVSLGGQSHSSDPASGRFDPALAGANRETLSGIRVEGGRGQETTPEQGVQLALASQTVAHGLTVQTDGPVDVIGAVQAQGPVAITAATISVHGRLQGTTVDLTGAGLVNVAAKGSVAAERIGVTAGVFIAAGQLHADGVHGGEISVQAGNMLQGGRISADGTAADGGTVQVHFSGSYIATAPAVTSADGVHGGQVTIDGGATGRLFSSGTQEALGRSANGTVALGGGDVILVDATADASAQARASGFHLIDPHPTRTGTFGFSITPLSNGNVVVTNPHDNLVAPDSGAVYLVQGRTGALLGALAGSTAGDRLGDTGDPGGDGPLGPGPNGPVGDGVVLLTNGNYVVLSPRWNAGRGAATWGNGTTGITGTVDASNSLIGSSANDGVGGEATALRNGNYVVTSRIWNGGRGAATWGDGTIGVTGAVDASNSLVGTNANDRLGGVLALSNGNYVVGSLWNGNRGAVTWGNGTIGITGTVDASNSLVGTNANDDVGWSVAALSNGNYVVLSPYWDGGFSQGRGAATWGDGTLGVTGTVDADNSLIGSNPNDNVGFGRVTALGNGNYVVASPNWNSGRGAATWGDGAIGITGTIDAGNSLIGSNPNDYVGSENGLESAITALSNGNYVVRSPRWNGNRGAATWGNGTIGVTGTVDASNSLVGSSAEGGGGGLVTALSNGNYVVSSPSWNAIRGAVTWGDGTIGITGTVDASNSLVGSHPNDFVGYAIIALRNGNYVVSSPVWNGNRGAVTWGDGTTGVAGIVDAGNSLVGSRAGGGFICGGSSSGDCVGWAGLYVSGIRALSNGNYVILSPYWNGTRGAATWGDGTIGITGTVDASNSLIGSNPNDSVGADLTALTNGNYVVSSFVWNGARGAVTWADGNVGITGIVDASNSLVGGNPFDEVGRDGVTALTNGNYVVRSSLWNVSRGAATFGNGMVGTIGTVDAGNSLLGSNTNDRVGLGRVTGLSNGNYVVLSPYWNGIRGAATWGDGTVGVTGTVDAGNSLIGSNARDFVGSGEVTALSNGNYVVASPNWNGERGAVTWGNGTIGAIGIVDSSNSLVGSDPGDQVGFGYRGNDGIRTLTTGNYLVFSPHWNSNRGAVTWADGTAGIVGPVDVTNSLVG